MVRVVPVDHHEHLTRQPLVEEVVGAHRVVVEAEEVPSLEVVEVGVALELQGWMEGWGCGLGSCCLVPAFGGQLTAFGLD